MVLFHAPEKEKKDELPECNMTLHNADECTKRLIYFGDRDLLIPSTDIEMDKHCEYIYIQKVNHKN